MALVDFDGFESGVNLRPSVVASNSMTAITGRDGIGVGLQHTLVATANVVVTIAPTTDTIYWHQGCRPTSATNGSTNTGSVLFTVYSDARTVAHLTANFNSSGQMTLRLGGSTGTIIATSTLTMAPVTAWHSFEAKATIADSGGECIIKVDGVEWINFTGDTKNGGTSTRPDGILMGVGTSGGYSIDDFLIVDTSGTSNNTWTGEISIVGVRPSGNGANSVLVGSDGNSVNNYQQVDENPFNTTDYNGSPNVGDLDTYDMTAVGKTGTVIAVQNIAYAVKSDAGTKNFKHVTRSSGGTLLKSSAIPLSTTYAIYSGPIWLTDADGNPWTVARVDSAEFGFEVA